MLESMKENQIISSEGESFVEVEIDQMAQVLALIPIDIALASTLLLLEIAYKYLLQRERRF